MVIVKKQKLLNMSVVDVKQRLLDREETANINCTDVINCVNCEDCHRCKACDTCEDCEDCIQCHDCISCFGCKGLVGGELQFLNVQLNQNEYDGMMAKIKA